MGVLGVEGASSWGLELSLQEAKQLNFPAIFVLKAAKELLDDSRVSPSPLHTAREAEALKSEDYSAEEEGPEEVSTDKAAAPEGGKN